MLCFEGASDDADVRSFPACYGSYLVREEAREGGGEGGIEGEGEGERDEVSHFILMSTWLR